MSDQRYIRTCPFLTIASQDQTPGGAPLHDCLEQGCALWDTHFESCALAALPAVVNKTADDIFGALTIISDAIGALDRTIYQAAQGGKE